MMQVEVVPLFLLSTAHIILQSASAISATAFVGPPSYPAIKIPSPIRVAKDDVNVNDGQGVGIGIDDVRNDDELLILTPTSTSSSTRRRNFLSHAASATMGTFTASQLNLPTKTPQTQTRLPSPLSSSSTCDCCVVSAAAARHRLLYHPHPQHVAVANALVELSPPSSPSPDYDKPRNDGLDRFFSYSMSVGMEEYESKARPYKSRLFQQLFDSLSRSSDGSGSNNDNDNANDLPVVVEIGMGTFVNAPYYASAMKESALKGLDIISVDPNDYMFDYAKDSAENWGLLSSSSTTSTTTSMSNTSLRNVHGVAEALPFANGSIDAIVGTLTLCSVTSQERALSEIKRVLKPKTGKFLFWEHVLAEENDGNNNTGSLALQQKILSPIQTLVADGCHLNRRTGVAIQNAGFLGGVEMDYILLNGSASIISPTVFGIATA